jgi:hypothetical protein
MINDAAIIQQVYSCTFGSLAIAANCFNNMLRMTYLRHSAYAAAHNMDYYNIQGDVFPDMLSEAGAWAKVGLVKEMLDKGYKYVFWIDADAAIMDFTTDLRDAVKDCDIGACEHDPAKSQYLKDNKVDKHINVGVMYFKNTTGTKKFVDKWLASYPGPVRWADQGAFNALLIEFPGVVKVIDDKWNATVNVNECDKPVILAWHGIPYQKRYELMKDKLKYDSLEYPV